MIWTVLLIIAVSLVGIFFLIVSLILFPPISLGAIFQYTQNKKNVSVNGWWMHPWIASVVVNTLENSLSVNLFGRSLISRELRPEQRESENANSEDFTIKSSKINDVSRDEEYILKKSVTNSSDQENRDDGALPVEEIVNSENVENVLPEVDIDSIPLFEKKQEEYGSNESELNYNVPLFEKEANITSELVNEKKMEECENQAKKENIFQKLQKNRYFFIAKNNKWRKKMFRWLFGVLKRFFFIVRFDRFFVSVKAGVEDPSLLGKIFGFCEMVRYSLRTDNGRHRFKFQPIFMQYHFEGEGSLGIKTSVMMLMFPLFIAIVTFPYFTTFLLYWKSRKLK